jgi:hypothetical protein
MSAITNATEAGACLRAQDRGPMILDGREDSLPAVDRVEALEHHEVVGVGRQCAFLASYHTTHIREV